MTTPFSGFQPEAIHFLLELRANNDRAWFQPRKAEYERLLKEPLEALCEALGERFESRGIPLRADAGSPFRIYRDVRFSKDKSPYKTHVSASFPWAPDGAPALPRSRTESVHHAGGYFHFEPDEAYVGGGMWHPDRPRLDAWRSLVAKDPKRVKAAITDRAFVKEFGEVDGDRLVRVPPGYAADDPNAELLKLKDVTFGRRVSDEEVLSPDLPDILTDAYAKAMPVFRVLASLSP
ncbi:MAG: DUF2461 domain-containing protein [Candidatus Limnocylindria bacterium]